MTRFFIMITLFLVFNATTTLANPSLEDAFGELTYSLTVEWDQKDEDFYQAANTKFANALIALREQGLTNEDFKKFITKKLKERGYSLDVDYFFNSISVTKMSAAEVDHILTEAMKKSFSEGVAWGPMVGTVKLMVAALGMTMVLTAVCGEDCEED